MTTARKSPWLVLLPVGIMLVVVWGVVVPWLLQRRGGDVGSPPLVPSLVSAAGWLAVLWWAVHQLVFRLAALWPVRLPPPPPDPPAQPVRFVVFYTTCDDFQPGCCLSCLAQDYPREAFRVAVCDDSRSEAHRAEVAAFCAAHDGLVHLRRPDRAGYKAGNLNHAFRRVAEDSCDWVVIADADQTLPATFLADLARFVAAQPADVAIVQAGRDPSPAPPPAGPGQKGKPFQDALQADIHLFYERDMFRRGRFGFLPFLGHGGALRQVTWKRLGGFPPVVSEDYAYAMLARKQGFRGERAEAVRSWDTYPVDFAAFVVRLSKFSGGAAELLRRCFPGFVRGEASWPEKLDAAMLLATYAVMPLILANQLLSAYLCHHMWVEQIMPLAPPLAYLFLGMFLLSFPAVASVEPDPIRAIRHWFWAFAVHAAAMPVAAWEFIRALFKPPVFTRTPKEGQPSPTLPLASLLVCAAGFCGLGLAWAWWSPFSPLLASTSVACASFPLYRWLHEDRSWRSRVGRTLVYVPGLTFIAGLVTMWFWATS